MQGISRRRYTDDFKTRAIVLAELIGPAKAARQLDMPVKTLDTWLDAAQAGGALGPPDRKPARDPARPPTGLAGLECQHNEVHPQAAVAPGYLANHAARLFNRRVDTALRPHGLTLALIGPLLLLSWKGPMLQRDLVRSSAIRQPAMVALLDKLEAMALIVRTPSITDRRAALVGLTDQGHEAARTGGKSLIDANERGLDGFSPEDAANLVILLQRLIANFEQD